MHSDWLRSLAICANLIFIVSEMIFGSEIISDTLAPSVQ